MGFPAWDRRSVLAAMTKLDGFSACPNCGSVDARLVFDGPHAEGHTRYQCGKCQTFWQEAS